MSRIQRFTVSTLRIEAQRTDRGWTFYAWRPHTSQPFTDSASLLRWTRWPAKTPTGDALRQWIAGLEEAPTAPEQPAHAALPNSFDPLAHGLDPDDPNHATRTIV